MLVVMYMLRLLLIITFVQLLCAHIVDDQVVAL
jgi:hypothetical protein